MQVRKDRTILCHTYHIEYKKFDFKSFRKLVDNKNSHMLSVVLVGRVILDIKVINNWSPYSNENE